MLSTVSLLVCFAVDVFSAGVFLFVLLAFSMFLCCVVGVFSVGVFLFMLLTLSL